MRNLPNRVTIGDAVYYPWPRPDGRLRILKQGDGYGLELLPYTYRTVEEVCDFFTCAEAIARASTKG